jgi:hypothetical protein
MDGTRPLSNRFPEAVAARLHRSLADTIFYHHGWLGVGAAPIALLAVRTKSPSKTKFHSNRLRGKMRPMCSSPSPRYSNWQFLISAGSPFSVAASERTPFSRMCHQNYTVELDFETIESEQMDF